jgi:protein TonB
MNWSGKVTLSFVIGEDGSVSGIRVVESSGYSLLDRSAVDAVKNVASFPKPSASAEIVMPIQFKLM